MKQLFKNIFIFSTLANGMQLANYTSLTSCLSIWTWGAERKHRSEEERDSEKSNCRRWERVVKLLSDSKPVWQTPSSAKLSANSIVDSML